MTLEFGVPGSSESGTPFSYQAPYASFLVTMAGLYPNQWIVAERRRVPPSGPERQVEVRRLSGRHVNVQRRARQLGACIDITTRVSGEYAATYVRGDAG